ncbi:acyl-coenzyme A diphosphatase NUDT19-like [Antedon mediterranea]|uniref:acyl-coenzyme A diphosphatase NUDT19-like n=1 Tax=Antedon mediterranea TaxID=105859 RepID=UPI003AF91865
MKYWKEAASLIVAANRRNGIFHPHTISSSTAAKEKGEEKLSNRNKIRKINDGNVIVRHHCESDFSILLMQRAQSSSFFAGAEVFPGGALDNADTSPDWLEFFEEAGISTKDFGKMLSVQGQRPLVFTNKQTSPLPREVAFRICAIRETFEEAGLLLLKSFKDIPHKKTEVTFAKNYEHPSLSEVTIDEWRRRVHGDASQFIMLCRELQCVPDVWSLMEWCDWLTPATNKKRYDTMFFLCCMNDVPLVKHDAQEMIQTKWSLPTEALQSFQDKQVYLPPPQIYELSRIENFKSLQDLFDFSSQRAFLGCETTFPVLYLSEDGKVVSAYPGDDIYPKVPEFKTINAGEMAVLNKTAEQSLKESKNVNRMVFKDSTECSLYYNIIPRFGHVAPALFNNPDSDVQSKL